MANRKFCPSCGTPVVPPGKFCSLCGFSLSTTKAIVEPSPQSIATKPGTGDNNSAPRVQNLVHTTVDYDDFLAHVINLTTRSKYVCLTPGKVVVPEMWQQIDAQVQTHEDRLGRFYNFFLSQGLDDANLGVFDFVKDHILGMGTTRGSSEDALAQLAEYLEYVDFVAVQIGTLGAKFLVAINGDRQSVSSLLTLGKPLNGIGDALLELQGAWKLKLAGMKIGKGVGMDVMGSVMFTFSNRDTLEQLRSPIGHLQLGTSQGERLKKAVKMSILNPLLFGHKGSIYLSKLIFNLSDRTVEVPEFWRSLTAKAGIVDRLYYGFTPEELLPQPRRT